MIKAVLLNRLTDGLTYCETTDGYNNQQLQTLKTEIKKHHKQVTPFSKDPSNAIKQIQNNNYAIYYKIENYVIFTAICENTYSFKNMLSFIEKVARSFFDEAKCILGAENLRSRLEAIEAPHYFAKYKFDRVIKKIQNEYQNISEVKNTDRLKKELQGIQNIIKVSMIKLDQRHKDLQKTEEQAKRLRDESKSFHDGTKKLKWNLWMKKNLIWVVLALFALVFYFCIF